MNGACAADEPDEEFPTGPLFGPCLPGIPRSCFRIELALAGVGELMNFDWCGAVGLNWPVPTFDSFPASLLPVAVAVLGAEAAALTDAAASAATSSVTSKAPAVANLRRFTDSS